MKMAPKELKYTKEHEWVKLEGEEALIGITFYAQMQLGDITFVELPAKGKEVKQSESIAVVESVKAASDVYSPVSGKIVEVNEALRDAPETINKSPFDEGWICRISVNDAGELKNLMDAAAYENYLKELKK